MIFLNNSILSINTKIYCSNVSLQDNEIYILLQSYLLILKDICIVISIVKAKVDRDALNNCFFHTVCSFMKIILSRVNKSNYYL